MFRVFLGGDACGPIAMKFCTGIDNQSISSNMKKICIELMTSQIITVIIVKRLAEKTVKESKKSI